MAIGLDGAPVATFWEGDRDINITLRLKENERQNVQNLADLYVQSPSTGASLPLRSIATLTPELQPSRIVHRNGVPRSPFAALQPRAIYPARC